MREKQKTTKAGGLTPEQQEKWKAIFANADARWKKEKAALAQAEELVLCRNPEDLDAALFQLLDARDMIFEAADFGIRAPTDAEFSSEWNDAEECALSHEDIAWQYIWQIKKAKRYIELIEKLCERY